MDNEQLIQDELQIIRRLSNADPKNIVQFSDGHRSRTYLIDDGRIVFRFPRSQAGRAEYMREVPVLGLLRERTFDVSIPVINWSSPGNAYIGCYGVVGRLSVQDAISSLSDQAKGKVGDAIGGFLKQLHAIKPEKGCATFTVKAEIERYQANYTMSLPTLEAYFSDDELLLADTFFMKEMPETMARLGGQPAFCHGDLGLYNMILSEDHKVGIIGFGDAGLWDESKDFMHLEDEIILEHALAAYGDRTGLREKIDIRRKAFPCLEIDYYRNLGNEKGIEKWVAKLKAKLGLCADYS